MDTSGIIKVAREVGEAALAEKAWKTIERIYNILLRPQVAPIHDLAAQVSIFPAHRRIVAGELYEAAFASGKELIYLTIMSKHSFFRMPERIKRAQESHTTINVLTWDPSASSQTLRSFGMHIGEEKTAAKQVRDAYSDWYTLAMDYPTVFKNVRAYLSSPTMQGVVVLDDWALIELLPFHTAPEDRPAMFLSASLDTHLFPLFQSSFKNLLAASVPVDAPRPHQAVKPQL